MSDGRAGRVLARGEALRITTTVAGDADVRMLGPEDLAPVAARPSNDHPGFYYELRY